MWQQKEITMAAIRLLLNVNLKVSYQDEDTMVPFGAGDIFNVISIEVSPDGYNNIIMPDGSVIRGVDNSVFENMGNKVPVLHVEDVPQEPDNQEFFVEEPVSEAALLDGTMLGEKEDAT
jgi:hypothetical protein